jgi:hypothetical protein
MSIKNKYNVKSIDSFQCREWLLYKHYAKRLCSISYSFGLFDENDLLIGVLTIGKPASNQLCIGVCGLENSEKVYELNRLCVNDGLEKNVLSFFVSSALNLIKENLILVSYADTKMNHNGYIYQALNWIYTGSTKERTDIGNNDNSHSRHYDKNINKKLNRKYRSSKHRYIYFLNKAKKIKSQLKYKQEPYPKGENKRYDSTYATTTQILLTL